MADLSTEILATAGVRVAGETSLAEKITAPTFADREEQPAGEEFRLGLFELPIDSNPSDSEK